MVTVSGARSLLVRGVSCLVNSVNVRDHQQYLGFIYQNSLYKKPTYCDYLCTIKGGSW